MTSSSDDDVPLAARHRPNPSTAPKDDSSRTLSKPYKGPVPHAPKATQNGRTTLAKRQSDGHQDGAARKKAREKVPNTETFRSPRGEGPSLNAEPTRPAGDGTSASQAQTPQKQKKEKKVYGKLGQTRDTPEEDNPLRKFYTSLLEQRPDSQMAKKWCMMHGLLSEEEAEAWLKENQPNKLKKSPSGGRTLSRMTPRKPNIVKQGETGKKRKRMDGEWVPEERYSSQQGQTQPIKPRMHSPVIRKAEVQRRKKIIRKDLGTTAGGKKNTEKSSADAHVQRIMSKVPENNREKLKKHTAEPLKKLAFFDGGLDTSDEDDIPLGKRISAEKL